MGAVCSTSESQFLNTELNDSTNKNENETTILNNVEIFKFRTYHEYNEAMITFNNTFNKSLSKLLSNKGFIYPKQRQFESNFTCFDYIDDIIPEKLFNISWCVYQKIGKWYGTWQSYPKEELAKINYGLIARYAAYGYNQEEEFVIITEKIIKRINFFTENFPFKLKRLRQILWHQSIFVCGYDRNWRLNIYVEPNKFKAIQSSNSIPCSNNKYLNEDHFYFDQTKQLKNKELTSIEAPNYSDYITYIFFIIEHVIPVLKKKWNISDLINLVINFNGWDVDTEMICYIMTNFNSIYPLGLGKVHVVNFNLISLKNNITFRSELDNIDYFRNLVFHNESYQMQLVKETDVTALPIAYGGYRSIVSDEIDLKSFKIEDWVNQTLSMILQHNII